MQGGALPSPFIRAGCQSIVKNAASIVNGLTFLIVRTRIELQGQPIDRSWSIGMQMSQLHISFPGIIKPGLFKRNNHSAAHQGFNAHFPDTAETDCDQSPVNDKPAGTASAEPTSPRCKPVELRIIQNGEIYRSKAEESRLIELGRWHHRRQRRRRRFT